MRWWAAGRPEGEMRQALWASFDVARAASEGRSKAYDRLRCLADRGVVADDDDSPECLENVIGQVMEVASTKLTENRPDAQILTDGEIDKTQRRAKQLGGWVSAAARDIGLHQTVEAAWDEAMAVGTGAFRVFDEHGRPTSEIAYCEDLHVAPQEAKHNAVRTLYYERTMDRAQVAALFPDHRAAIEAVPVANGDHDDLAEGARVREWTDLVTVVEAWRLAAVPTTPGAEPDPRTVGRHVIALRDVTLLDEPYDDTSLPFFFLRWRPRRRSFWGIGIPELLETQQALMNLHGSTAEETLQTLPPSLWMDQADGGTAQQMDDVPGRVYTTPGGKAPTLIAPTPGLLAAFTAREAEYRERMFSSMGVSQMEAGAGKPAGLNSGKAQLVHQDIKSKRLLLQARQVEDAYTWAFERLIMVADAIVEAAGEAADDALTYLAGEGSDLMPTPYTDVRISDMMFRARVFPISRLPDSPAGRLEFISELLQLGIVHPQDAMGLLAIPDVEGFRATQDATRELARALCDAAVSGDFDTGAVTSMLTPMDDLGEVSAYGHSLLSRLRLRGQTPEDLAELRSLLSRAAALQADSARRVAEEMQARSPAPPQGPEMAPQEAVA